MKKHLLVLSLALAVSQGVYSDQVEDLSGAVDQIGTDAQDVTTLSDKYQLTNAGQCALMVMGTSATHSAPVSFIPGPHAISGLQADVIVGPGLTITSVVEGPAAQNAGKTIQSAPVPGGQRFLLFGVNDNSLGAGKIATVNFDVTGASAGPHIIALVNFVAADASGTGIPLCVTSGVITK